MKKTIFIIAACILATTSFAQTTLTKEDIQIVQSVFGKEKKELVQQYLVFSPEQSNKFWPLYEEYEKKRAKLSSDRIIIIEDYAKVYENLDDNTANALAKRVFSNDMETDKLHEQYFKKISAAVGGVNAAKFFQMESYLQSIIRVNTQDQIPFIGELENSKKAIEKEKI